MSEASDHKSSHAGYVAVLVILPVLYVLSVGPAALIAKRNGGTGAGFRRFYQPVIWLHDHTFFQKPLEVYVELWGVK